MKSPTRSIAAIRRQLTRARRDGVMVVLHPDTVEWLALVAAARENCVLETKEARGAVRLLGVLQNELEITIDSNWIPGQDSQPKEIRDAQRNWKAAEELVATLTGTTHSLKPNRYSGAKR